MKKLSAILLAGLLFFNWYGYRLLFAFWQQHADRRIEAQLDNSDYDQSALISVRVPASHLAYFNVSADFERVNGVIQVGNITYRYVKRRIFRDSIELLCIPDASTTDAQHALNELAGRVNTQHFPTGKTFPGPVSQKVYTPAFLHFLLRSPDPVEASLTAIPVPTLRSGHDRPAERPPAASALFCC